MTATERHNDAGRPDEHLDMAELLRMALSGETHAHLAQCAFCREQLHEARQLLHFETDGRSDATRHDHREAAAVGYRLAAQSEDAPLPSGPHVRRTWYPDAGRAILRVMEDAERGRLYGHLIVDPLRYPVLRVRFSDIPHDFRTDRDGLFDIGPASLDIEAMDVTLIEDATGE